MKWKPNIQIKQNQNRQILDINNTITTTYLQKCKFFVEKNSIKSIQYFSVRGRKFQLWNTNESDAL